MNFFQPNVDASRTEQNIVWKDETTAHAYHRIFDDAVSEYNAKQKRKDRQIKDYRTHCPQFKKWREGVLRGYASVGKAGRLHRTS